MAYFAAGVPLPELVDVLVSPEWATAVMGVSTGHLQVRYICCATATPPQEGRH